MTAPASPAAEVAGRFLLKQWVVSVRWSHGAITSERYTAATRGKAMADAWRCDAFSGCTFKEFLGFASCRRDHSTPEHYGDPITVAGKPAFFVSNNRQYVRFVYPDQDHVMNSHPYDVLPVEYRPDTYRGRDEIDGTSLKDNPHA